jgi:hypothetical protein
VHSPLLRKDDNAVTICASIHEGQYRRDCAVMTMT